MAATRGAETFGTVSVAMVTPYRLENGRLVYVGESVIRELTL